MTDPQHEVASAINSLRMAMETLHGRTLATDDVHALDAVGADIANLIRPQTRTEPKGTQHG